MLKTLRNAWRIEDLRKKILFTLLIILLYRLGNAVPVPYVNTALLAEYFASLQNTVLGRMNRETSTVDHFPRDFLAASGHRHDIRKHIIYHGVFKICEYFRVVERFIFRLFDSRVDIISHGFIVCIFRYEAELFHFGED